MKIVQVRPDGSKRVATVNEEPTRTQQQWKDMVNVNNIMAKYKRTGSISHLRNVQNGVYADLTTIPDYMSALMTVHQAREAFESLPALVREKFKHDPAQLIDYLKDPKNKDEAIELGLVKKPVVTPTPPSTPGAGKKEETPSP